MGLEIVCAGKNWKKGGKNVGKSILIKRLQCFIENTVSSGCHFFIKKNCIKLLFTNVSFCNVHRWKKPQKTDKLTKLYQQQSILYSNKTTKAKKWYQQQINVRFDKMFEIQMFTKPDLHTEKLNFSGCKT